MHDTYTAPQPPVAAAAGPLNEHMEPKCSGLTAQAVFWAQALLKHQLLLSCRQQGLVVQGFKVGPDFLDPMHHAAATGRPSINLDGWMMTRQQVLDSFHRCASIHLPLVKHHTCLVKVTTH
jgi:hypothetical protein